MKRWAVKHIPTGHYIPEPNGRRGRGGSHVDPNPDSNIARLFMSERAAKIYITSYCKGKVLHETDYSCDYEGNRDGFEFNTIVPQPNRLKEDFEIIPLEIKLP